MKGHQAHKILFVGHLPPPSTGEGNVLLTYFQTLPQMGYQVQLFDTGIRSSKYKPSTLTLYAAVRAIRHFMSFILVCLSYRPRYVSLMFTSGTLPILKFSVFCHIAHLFSYKVIAQHHAGEILAKWKHLNHISQCLALYAINLPDAWIVSGRKWYDFLVERNVSDKQISLIPNAVKNEILPLLSKPHHSANNDVSAPLKTLFVGTLTRRKGLDVLLRAIINLGEDSQQFKFLILGGEGKPGEREAIMRSFENNLEEASCIFLSPLEGDDYLDLLSSCDIFVLPSYAENLPVALLEAMAAGLAVIATSVGAIPSIIGNNERGILIPVGDAESLTNALRRLERSPSLRQALCEQARKYIRDNHLPEMSAREFVRLIEKLAT